MNAALRNPQASCTTVQLPIGWLYQGISSVQVNSSIYVLPKPQLITFTPAVALRGGIDAAQSLLNALNSSFHFLPLMIPTSQMLLTLVREQALYFSGTGLPSALQSVSQIISSNYNAW